MAATSTSKSHPNLVLEVRTKIQLNVTKSAPTVVNMFLSINFSNSNNLYKF